MLDLGQTEFRLAVPGVASASLESLSNSLFDEWEHYVGQALSLSDYSLFLQVDEGSINGWGKIKAGAGVFVVGISAYGGFFSGLEIIGKQLLASRNFLAEHALTTFSCPLTKATTRKSGGSPAYLQRLFARVQRGELTADEATLLAQNHFAEGANEAPGLIEMLTEAFKECPKFPIQFSLALEELGEISIPQYAPQNSPSPPKPKPKNRELPPPLKYRVEVWRDSKRNLKRSKVSPL
ncbi:MAG: hypothetical protein RJB34_1496 [Pseudomonadota bacterium]|jgi:hypothetical protein